MPNHYSAIKRLKQTERRTAANRRNKGALRAGLRDIRVTMAEANVEKTQQAIRTAFSRIDKSVQKGVVHKNTAGRLKSRLMARLNAAAAPKTK